MHKKFSLLLVILLPIILSTTDSYAASGGAHDVHHQPGLGSLVWPVINFSLYISLIAFFYVRKGKGLLKDYQTQVINHVQRSQKEYNAAEAAYLEAFEKLQDIEASKKELTERLRVDGENIAAKILEETEESIGRMSKDTSKLIERELLRAKQQFRSALVVRAGEIARDSFEKKLSDSQDANLRKDTLACLERGLLH